jgi:hypothetical protein
MTLTNNIFQLSAPYNNPYQNDAHKALFVCSAGLLRSATCATMYSKKGWNTRAAGSSSLALVPVTANLLAWADRVYFVNKENHTETLKKFKSTPWEDKVNNAIVLNIPDSYMYMDPYLQEIIEEQM